MLSPDPDQDLRGAEVLERREQYPQALQVALEVLAAAPGDSRASALAGRCLAALERHAEGIPFLERAVLASPEAKLLCHLGQSLLRVGRVEYALDTFSRATQLSPGLAWGWHGHGEAALALADHAAAERSLTEALRLRPDLAEAFLSRGFARLGLGRYSEARADLREALRLQPALRARLSQAGPWGLGL